MGADQFAVLTCGRGPGVKGGADRADVATDQGRHISAANLHLSGQADVGRLAHGVGGGDGGDHALGLDQAEGVGMIASGTHGEYASCKVGLVFETHRNDAHVWPRTASRRFYPTGGFAWTNRHSQVVSWPPTAAPSSDRRVAWE